LFPAFLPLTIDKSISYSLVERHGGRMPQPADLLQGTLDMLILRAIANEPQHGWAIALRIQQVSNNVLQVGQGSLYPALHRLEYKGWIKAQWGASDNNRKARYYTLTAAGRKHLASEVENWERLAGAVNLVLADI
jgi:transcriptional regulator